LVLVRARLDVKTAGPLQYRLLLELLQSGQMQLKRDRLSLERATPPLLIAAITSAGWKQRVRATVGAGRGLACLTAAFIRRDFNIDWNPRPG
jgi:hypothetical protein